MEKDTALLIIDVQVSMFSSLENTSVFESDRVLTNICILLQKARNKNIPVIFIQHTVDNDPEYGEGKPTWQLHPRLKPLSTEKIICKSTCDSFHMTKLQEELEKLGIRKLVIAGMQSDFCVDTTCRRAFSMGYDSVLVEDAHSTFDSHAFPAEQIIKHHNNILGAGFVKLKPTSDIEF